MKRQRLNATFTTSIGARTKSLNASRYSVPTSCTMYCDDQAPLAITTPPAVAR